MSLVEILVSKYTVHIRNEGDLLILTKEEAKQLKKLLNKELL